MQESETMNVRQKRNASRIAQLFMILLTMAAVIFVSDGTVNAETKWKKITKKNISFSWYNNAYYNDELGTDYTSDYVTTFTKNGKVIQKGYRNKDCGTYKISRDKKKVVATFNKCYFDTPGKGYVRIKKYKYTVTYRMKNKYTLYAKYSKAAEWTNAGSGYLYR